MDFKGEKQILGKGLLLRLGKGFLVIFIWNFMERQQLSSWCFSRSLICGDRSAFTEPPCCRAAPEQKVFSHSWLNRSLVTTLERYKRRCHLRRRKSRLSQTFFQRSESPTSQEQLCNATLCLHTCSKSSWQSTWVL